MPSTITHSYFILDVYNKLDIDTKMLLKDQKEKLKIFSQGLDPLNFYSSIKHKKAKSVRNFSETFHTTKTKEFIITLINYIKYNYYSYNPEALALLYSYISHYVLDSTIHPYVYYKTGEFNKKNKETYKYNSKHHELETSIDRYLIKEKENINPKNYKHYLYNFNLDGLSDNIKEILNFCFKETYGIQNFDKAYIKSIKNMKKAFKLFRYDPLGIKKTAYYVFDFITPKKILNTKFLSYNYTPYKDYSFLNDNKKTWYNPCDKKKKSNSSFNDLYKQSIKNCVSLINSVNDYLYDRKKVNLDKIIKNTSCKTGLDIESKKELKYFEF